MWRRRDAHRQSISAIRVEHGADIEAAAKESAFHIAEIVPVQPDLRGVVDSFELERGAPPGGLVRCLELNAVPVVLLVQRLGDSQIIQTEIGVRVYTTIDHRGEHRARHGGSHPFLIIKSRGRDCLSRGYDLGSRCEHPVRSQHPLPGCAGWYKRRRGQ